MDLLKWNMDLLKWNMDLVIPFEKEHGIMELFKTIFLKRSRVPKDGLSIIHLFGLSVIYLVGPVIAHLVGLAVICCC
jgi:hypothetical protein